MQNKGLIKFITILFALVSIYQLSFTFIANKVKQDAKEFANGDLKKEIEYLNDVDKKPVFLNFTYNDVKGKQINKGLDLEGGINVILEISVRDILKGLANNTTEPTFNKSLEDAKKNQKGNQTYLDAFYEAFAANSKGEIKLASPDIFANKNLAEEVTFTMTDDEVKKVINRKVDESVTSAFEVLRKRIDKFGVTQPNLQRLGQSGRILVELPGAKDIDRVTKLLQSTAQLEFWETFKIEEIGNYLSAVNDALKLTEKATTTETPAKSSGIDSLLTTKDKQADKAAGVNPLTDKMVAFSPGGAILGYFSPKDTATVNEYLKRNNIKALLTPEQRFAKFVWGKPTNERVLERQVLYPTMPNYNDAKAKKVEVVELYALKGNKNNQAPISGGVVVDAFDTFDQLGKPAVSMQMNGKGAKQWEELTGKAYTQKSNIAIVLDNVVYSAPGVSSGAIAGGNSIINGTFTVEETKDLANVLRAGKLPAAAEIVQKEIVGPSLGQKAIDAGTMSSIIGLLLVSLWMVFYYGRAGWYANIALAINLLFIFGVMASFGFVLTLPGIAGIVLTMGTAVDANIIIYERAKEELRHGKSLEEAVKSSYSWTGAMRSIVDANVTHVLTGAILYIFGTGPIQGFALTLLIGIVTSLFTSIFIARLFLDKDIEKGRAIQFSTPTTKNWFTNFHYNFLGFKKWAYVFSGVVIVVSFISFYINGLDQGIDFVGGRTFQVKFEKPVEPSQVQEDLAKVFGSVEAKIFGTDDQLKITTKYKIKEEGVGVDTEVNKMLFDALKKYFSADMTYEKFTDNYDGKTLGVLQAIKVNGAISEDIKTNSYWAVIGAMAVVFLYLMISFRKWQYSLGAIAAVAHDVIFVLGIYSLLYKIMPFSMEMDQHFIAAILTVIGYSMNDTVIVFDRIREFLGGKTKGTFNDIVNSSINTTLSRTINTSLTMVLVLLIMFIFGGESIRGFIFAMLVGIVVGTYSSLFIATPVLVDTVKKKEQEAIEKRHAELAD